MKKFLVSMMAVITAVLLVACSNASNKDLVHVGVLQYVEHPSLSATRKRFIEELKEEGYVDGKNIKIDYQNAQGDQSNLQTISQSLIEDNDVMLAIATPAAQSLSSLTKDKPILFTAVTDPVSAKLVKSMDNVGGNVTGTSDMSPINKQVELLKRSFQTLKKLGLCTRPVSVTQKFRLKKPRNTSRKLVLKRLLREFHPPMISKTQPRA